MADTIVSGSTLKQGKEALNAKMESLDAANANLQTQITENDAQTNARIDAIVVEAGSGNTAIDAARYDSVNGVTYGTLGARLDANAAQLADNAADIEGRGINVKFPPAPLVAAIGNGVANDTTAIQGAIDMCSARGGGVVYLPAGKYRAHLNLKSNVRLVGAGRNHYENEGTLTKGNTILMPHTAGTPVLSLVAGSTGNFRNAGVRDLSLDGQEFLAQTGAGNDGLYIMGAAYCTFENVTVNKFGRYGIYLTSGTSVQNSFYNCFINIGIRSCATSNLFINYGTAGGYVTATFFYNLISNIGSSNTPVDGNAMRLKGELLTVNFLGARFETATSPANNFILLEDGAEVRGASIFSDTASTNDVHVKIVNAPTADWFNYWHGQADGKIEVNGIVSAVSLAYYTGMYANGYYKTLDIADRLRFGNKGNVMGQTNTDNACYIDRDSNDRMNYLSPAGHRFFNSITNPLMFYGKDSGGTYNKYASMYTDENGMLRISHGRTVPLATDGFLVGFVAVPASKTASGKQGQISADASYYYICYADNNWIRIAKDATW